MTREHLARRLDALRAHIDGELGRICAELRAGHRKHAADVPIDDPQPAAADFLLTTAEIRACERCGVDWLECVCDPTAGAGA